MSISSLLSLMMLFLTLLVIVQGQRQRRARRRRGPNTFHTGYALGNALQVLQTITQPSVRHLVTVENDEAAEDEDDGDPPSPEEDLRRQVRGQMRRVRRGEQIDRLRLHLR